MARRFIIGIDEAGRGPLAGPVTVAAVAAKSFLKLKNIKDSKKLSQKRREVWFKRLSLDRQFLISRSSVSHKIIDRIGISKAVSRAVKNCLRDLGKKYSIFDTKYLIQLDGSLSAPDFYQNQQTIIKGDEKIPIIAAASIIAKVVRDRKMAQLAQKYPDYGFEIHKGYGTKAHSSAIKQYGVSEIHRLSYCRKFL
ncbi:MAG: ribonuclease HII [Patescibacteria group bacterium]